MPDPLRRAAQPSAVKLTADKTAAGSGSFWWALGGVALLVLCSVIFALSRGPGTLMRPTAPNSPMVTPRPTIIAPPSATPFSTDAFLQPTPKLVPTIAYPPAGAFAGDAWTSPTDGMVMVYVPAGEFLMGSDSENFHEESPIHAVTLDAFWIDQMDVTNAMFARFVARTHYKTGAEWIGAYVFNRSAKSWDKMSDANWQHPRGPSSDLSGLDGYPVVQVNWNDATAYCQWAGRRLPTEAEWEKAARGTDGRTYPWGNQKPAGNLLNFADMNLDAYWADNHINDGYQFTAPAGNYPDGASPYGALDMAGNVKQWVADWYGETYYSSTTTHNPSGPSSGEYRVMRGGSWVDYADYVRSSYRGWNVPNTASDLNGFRCSRSP